MTFKDVRSSVLEDLKVSPGRIDKMVVVSITCDEERRS